MKYYSEVLNKNFDTVEALENAEMEVQQRDIQKKLDKTKVEEARKEYVDAYGVATEKLKEFARLDREYRKKYDIVNDTIYDWFKDVFDI